MLRTRRANEDGVAMIAAVALLILGAFIAVAVFMSAKSTGDSASARLDASASEQLARDAGAMLASSYSTLVSGEHDGFVPDRDALQDHATRIGGTVVANSTLPANLALVDPRVTSTRRYTVRQDLRDGRFGFWQVYSVKLPDWGTTPGGRVVTYVRTWTTNAGGVTQPVMYRLEFRPTWFADYQMLFDGPQRVGAGATITGRVHSNGYSTSYYDQYRSLGAKIRFDPGATCDPGSARISTAEGNIVGAGGCRQRENTGVRYNFLRARDTAARLRVLCAGPASERPSIKMACPPTTGVTRVVLSGQTMWVSGVGNLDAGVRGNVPGRNQGAVVITSGDVEVSGTLGRNARALVVAASPPGASSYGGGGAPSAWIVTNGDVGAANDVTSSFGIVAEGDVIFDETRMSRATARGAFLTMSGMVSGNPTWRSRVLTNGGVERGGPIQIEGSMSGHFPPLLHNPDNHAGFLDRRYTWLDALYDNPPPLFPTASDWEITRMEPANLDCFAAVAGGGLNTARPNCS